MSAQSDRIEALLTRCIALLERQASAPSAASAPIVAAPDSELDSDKGDPIVKKTPPKWVGRDLNGCRYSELSIEELKAVASFKIWGAENPRAGADPKFVDYDRRDAARALGWIRRKQSSGDASF